MDQFDLVFDCSPEDKSQVHIRKSRQWGIKYIELGLVSERSMQSIPMDDLGFYNMSYLQNLPDTWRRLGPQFFIFCLLRWIPVGSVFNWLASASEGTPEQQYREGQKKYKELFGTIRRNF